MAKALSPSDPSSFSRPDLCVVKALHIDLDVDFERHILFGKVTLNVERKAADVKSLVSFSPDGRRRRRCCSALQAARGGGGTGTRLQVALGGWWRRSVYSTVSRRAANPLKNDWFLVIHISLLPAFNFQDQVSLETTVFMGAPGGTRSK